MTDEDGWIQGQQLLELLAVISSYPDEGSAVRGAAERAAQALEAEVAAVVFGEHVVASVDFPAGASADEDLVAVARQEQEKLTVPGVGDCATVTAKWGGTHPGSLVLARWGESFTIPEQTLVRGMARLLELTLTMLRALQRSERQAHENAELLKSLRQRQRLVEHLFDIQRAISRRRPLAQILDMITGAAQDLLGDEIVGLWLRDSPDGDETKLVAHVGLRTEVARHRPVVPLVEADAAQVAKRILRTLGEPMPIAGRQLRVNASIGIAMNTPGMPDPADLVRRADVAMYQAKRNGRGRLEIFTDEMLLSFPHE